VHRFPTIPFPNHRFSLAVINTEAIGAHLPLRRTRNRSPARIHKRPHLIRTALPRIPHPLVVAQRLAKSIRNFPRVHPNAVGPVVATTVALTIHGLPIGSDSRRLLDARTVAGVVANISLFRPRYWSSSGSNKLIESRQRPFGELGRGRGRQRLQAFPHFLGVCAGFFADFLLLFGREAGHGDIFAAEIGGAGLCESGQAFALDGC
jgi:hypothetical protein